MGVFKPKRQKRKIAEAVRRLGPKHSVTRQRVIRYGKKK